MISKIKKLSLSEDINEILTLVVSESANWVTSTGFFSLTGGSLNGSLTAVDITSTGKYYGDGSSLTGIIAGDSEATTLVRTNSADWQGTYTTVRTNSASWNVDTFDASKIISGIISAERLPALQGDVTTVTGSTSATVVKLQGNPLSNQAPLNGQILQWNGNSWVPGAVPTGGSGGGGLSYYFNFGTEAQSPTTNLSATPNTPKELGIIGSVAGSSYTLTNVSQSEYSLVCGFVTLTGIPNTDTIPSGLWDFNIWASSTASTTRQMILRLFVYKYDGLNSPTLLAQSDDFYLYDPIVTAQYIASVVFPQTTILTTDRIYIEIRAKSTQNGRNVTIHFGSATPSHVHTTLPSVGGSGLVKVVNGVYQTPASLLFNSDVAPNAAIDPSKINGLTASISKTDSVFTTVQTNSSTNWNYQGTDIKALTGNWQNTYTTVQTNSASWINSKTIAFFSALNNEPPATNFATLDTRNSHPVLDFDTTTQEAAIFRNIIPDSVGLLGGVNVIAQWATSTATTGTIGWNVAFERITSNVIDIDSDNFGTAQTITAITVPSTAGVTLTSSCSFTQAQLPSGLTNGDMYRLRIRRDVTNDTASGDAELIAVEVRSAA
jgi:hypothetical protein